MDQTAKSVPAGDLAAALAWWRDAGVDHDFADQPADWLTRDAPPRPDRAAAPAALAPAPAAPAPAAPPPGRPEPALVSDAQWPRELDAFTRWWLEEPSLDSGRISGRVPPRGPAGAACMIVVEEPEAEDTDLLLSGPQGRLLAGMLEAMGCAPENARIASVLPRNMPMPDWPELGRLGFGRLLAHHVAIAAPRRLILLGSNIPPLLGNNLPNSAENLPGFNHEGRSIPVYAARGLRALIERPRWKAGFWQGWLDWIRADPVDGQL